MNLTTYTEVQSIFGTPITPSASERIDIHRLRDEMAAPGDAPTAHLGEAETITLAIAHRIRMGDHIFFATDEGDATHRAKVDGITCVTTWQLIQIAHKQGILTRQDAREAAKTLRSARQGWPKGVGHTYADFMAWLLTGSAQHPPEPVEGRGDLARVWLGV